MIRLPAKGLVIPQLEHARLAGLLAMLWGNADFDSPDIDRNSFVLGVTDHDRGYGPLDNVSLADLADEDWLVITRRGFFQTCPDPTADLIVKLHLQRLADSDTSPLGAEMAAAIAEHCRTHNLSLERFRRWDRLTNLCDMISLDFCYERPGRSVTVFPQHAAATEVAVHYVIKGSKILVKPWPFSVESYITFMIGYREATYPSLLRPIIIPVYLGQQQD